MTDEWPPGEASVGVGSRGLGGRPESGDWSTSTRSGSNVRWSDVWFRSSSHNNKCQHNCADPRSSNCCPPITMRVFLPPTRRGARENNVKFCSPSASFTSCGPQPYRGHKLSSPRLWIPPITTVLCGIGPMDSEFRYCTARIILQPSHTPQVPRPHAAAVTPCVGVESALPRSGIYISCAAGNPWVSVQHIWVESAGVSA